MGNPRALTTTLIANECTTPTPPIPLLRFCDGGLCLRVVVLKSDRSGQGNLDTSADFRHRDLPGRGAVLPDLLHFRRHPDRSVRLWAGSPGRMGGICR